MTMLTLNTSAFPTTEGFQRAKWTPVLLRPIFGSPEQLVIGVIAINETGFYLERANRLDRFNCLLDENASSVILAANAGLTALTEDLSKRAAKAIEDFSPVFSGVGIGEVREAQGESLQTIAVSWMAALSSVYERPSFSEVAETEETTILIEAAERPRDRLPSLIFEYVNSRRPGLTPFFSEEIQKETLRRRSNASAVVIDFAGSHIVANFGTLSASNHSASVDRIKRRLWDLKVDRDNEVGSLLGRDHEMLVQHPTSDDPQFSQRQYDRINDALKTLEAQADQEEIRFRPLPTIQQIGDHILQKEAA